MAKVESYIKTYKVANELYKGYKDINRKVPFINAGGCGAFAEHLYYTFKRLGFKPKLGVITENTKGMEQRIQAWRSKGHLCERKRNRYGYACVEHVVVLLDNFIIDSTGIYGNLEDHDDSYYHSMYITDKLCIKVLEDWNRNGTFWNDDFDRDKTDVIEAKLEACYNKVKKKFGSLK